VQVASVVQILLDHKIVKSIISLIYGRGGLIAARGPNVARGSIHENLQI